MPGLLLVTVGGRHSSFMGCVGFIDEGWKCCNYFAFMRKDFFVDDIKQGPRELDMKRALRLFNYILLFKNASCR